MIKYKLVEDNCVFLNQDLHSFDEIVQLTGRQFIQNGTVKDSYIQAVIDREAKFPTGLAADGHNIAIPHTDSNHVIRPGVGVVVTKKPIEVAMMGSPDIKLECRMFFPLAMEHPKKQLELLKKLMKFFQKKENLELIRYAKSNDEVLKVINQIEN